MFPFTTRMRGHGVPFLLALLLAPCSVNAQCDRIAGQATDVVIQRTTVRFGCEGSLYIMPPLQQARTQNEDLYHLIRDMRIAYRKALVSKAAQKAFDRKQKLWGRALRKVCDAESGKASKADVALCQEACRKWAGVCLLEDLLERYDAIINPMEGQP